MTVLSVATGLFLMFILSVDLRGNGLSIGHLGGVDENLDAELALQALGGDVNVGFPEALEHGLAS